MVDSINPDLGAIRRAAEAERARRAARPRPIADVTQPPSAPTAQTSELSPVLASTSRLQSLLRSPLVLLIALGFGAIFGAIANERGAGSDVSSLEAKISSLTQEKNAAEQRLAGLQAQAEQARSDAAQQKEQIANLRRELEQTNSKVAGQHQDLSDRKQALDKLQQQLGKRQEDLAKREAALPGGQPSRLEDGDVLIDQLGIRVTALTEDNRVQWGIDPSVSGVLVSASDPRQRGYRSGLRPGVIIIRVGKTLVRNEAQFAASVKSQLETDERLTLLIKIADYDPEWLAFSRLR